ncbi:MAG: hypothetical protein DHS20C12_14820 [Pseudohongiella sp.]|nr:MAG: hypothetical protein DHS20C12_14820 [Pseudohongiella sp.]
MLGRSAEQSDRLLGSSHPYYPAPVAVPVAGLTCFLLQADCLPRYSGRTAARSDSMEY